MILSYIQELLEKNDIPCHFVEANHEVSYDHLLVPLDTPIPNTECILEITSNPQHFQSNQSEENSYYLIQFQYLLPVSFTAETFHQVSSCLHFFNRLLHCPGFELDELSDQIFYRYVWFIKKSGIDSFLLMQVIGNTQLCFNMFSLYIKEIAEGKYTLEEILKKVTEMTKLKPL